MPEHLKRGFGIALLLIFSLVLAAATAEVGLRIAAAFSQDVRYLATAGTGFFPDDSGSLEDFLRPYSGGQLVPHQIHNSYYTNALGLYDREFPIEKPEGSLRLMALGDSFTYGSVSYPQNVLTLVQKMLNQNCKDRKFEIMNFGIPGTGLWEYKSLHRVAAPRYKPDRVIVHFYMGNDGPDLVFGNLDLPSSSTQSLPRSFAWTYLKNAVALLSSVNLGLLKVESNESNPDVRGGERAPGRKDLTDDDIRPSFAPDAFERIAALEVARLYRGRNRPFEHLWEKTLNIFDKIQSDVIATTGKSPVFILYPSEAQIYSKLRDSAINWLVKNESSIDRSDFDAGFPARMVLQFCQRRGIPCYDITPSLLAVASMDPYPLYHLRDTHWNVRGNYVAAAAEFEALRAQFCDRP